MRKSQATKLQIWYSRRQEHNSLKIMSFLCVRHWSYYEHITKPTISPTHIKGSGAFLRQSSADRHDEPEVLDFESFVRTPRVPLFACR
jgi:hypothetical protein